MRAQLSAAFLALCACALAAGCRSLPASKPEALWTVEEGRGAIVFSQKCARCHHPTTTSGQTLAFSIMVNGHRPGSEAELQAIDRIAEAIAASE